MTKLADGRVITIGGRLHDRRPLATVEVYDPRADKWTSRPSLPIPVWGSKVVTVDAHRALLVGGFDPGGPSSNAYWLDRATGAITPAPPTSEGYAYHELVALPDGVVVVLGLGIKRLKSGAWSALPSRPKGGADAAAAAVLPDGRVLVCGGRDAEDEHARQDSAIVDGRSFALPQAFVGPGRWGHQLAVLGDHAMAVGGLTGEPARYVNAWESWSADTGWKRSPLAEPRWLHCQVRLSDGSYLLIGGADEEANRPAGGASESVSRLGL